MTERQKRALRWQLSLLLDDDAPHSRKTILFSTTLALLIVVSVVAVILESVEPIRDKYPLTFVWIEHTATAVFAVEYVARLWVCVDYRGGRFRHPFWGRLRYVRSFYAIIDLIAVLPSLLGLLGSGDLRVLRLLRLLRMLKLTRRSRTFGLLWSVFREEAPSIAALIFALCLTLTISGALMYMVEAEQQPTIFNSIPAAMWWAIETLTTVGYGDMVPVTMAGRVLGGIVSIIGIGTLALFSGLITVGFLDQLKTRRDQPQNARTADEQDGAAALAFDRTMVPAQLTGICPRCGYVPPESEAFGHNRAIAGAQPHQDIENDKGSVDH
ncbi:MAG TPA: ion transporter [Xanthobacteraceae bacterium]|nr:ion transporter [Xanthobacteraceae bacterium]